MPTKGRVSDRIREAIEKADVTRYRIAQETGIEESALSRFMSRERGLSMEALDALAEFFGLELQPTKTRKVYK
jgi:transcriptional regulator with XRE-family HTH domain